MEDMVNPARLSLSSVYGGKRVFVTGHTGFKGAWLTAVLHSLGARVKGYALPPEYPDALFPLLEPQHIIESILADIRDGQRLQDELLAFQPDFIFHLAAQPLVRRSYEIPAETIDVNVTGTARLLEAAVRLEKDCSIVVITTDKVYENKEKADLLYREEDTLGGYDPYSASKACAELVVSSFRSSFFQPAVTRPAAASGLAAVSGTTAAPGPSKGLASARAGNVIGGGDQSRDRIIPDVVRALSAGRSIDVRNPDAVRPWQHVLEPVIGYLLLGSHLKANPPMYSKAYNFGPLPEGHLPVRELVEIAIDTWSVGDGSDSNRRVGSWTDASIPGAPHEASLLKLDITRAIKELGWMPKLDAKQAIQWTLEWYCRPRQEQAAYTFQQIKSYLAL